LFSAARKRPLPHLPRRIGVVTSRSGAAVRDIIRAVQRRFPVPILVSDTAVQGAAAPRQIAAAIAAICRTDVDVVIVGRGGGSAGDLAAFNTEEVVRAVAACPVPTISAVGHEVDVSLTDLVADRRAATPTMAGEMAVPVLADLDGALRKEERRLERELEMVLRGARQQLDQLTAAAEARLGAALARRRHALSELRRKLEAQHPRAVLVGHRAALRELDGRAQVALRRALDGGARQLASLSGRLQALSPLSVLERGYAIATAGEHVVTAAAQVQVGDPLTVRLSAGAVDCRVEAVHPGGDHPDDDGAAS
jgi:exodeoxyribonuclease VII large subunit